MAGEKKTLETGFVVGDSEIVHPTIGNTEPDGSGEWKIETVDDEGRKVVSAPGAESTLGEILIVLKEIREHQLFGS